MESSWFAGWLHVVPAAAIARRGNYSAVQGAKKSLKCGIIPPFGSKSRNE